MARKRTGGILMVLGVLVALMAFLITLSLGQSAAAQKPQTVNIVVALADIPERTPIQASSVGLREIPKDLIPPGAIYRAEDVVGRMAVSRIYSGEILMANRISDTKGANGVSFAIDPGKVIITLPASDIASTGALRVGDSVDLLVTIDLGRIYMGNTAIPGGSSGPTQGKEVNAGGRSDERAVPVSQVTLQNLQILAIGAVVPKDAPTTKQPGGTGVASRGSNDTLITFAISPQDALVLKFIKDLKDMGAASLYEVVLRAAGDEQIYQTEAIDIKYVLDRYRIRVP